jgi:hypothetical protein
MSSTTESSTNLGEMTDQAKHKAAETLDQVKQQAQSKIDQQKQQAADQLSGVAGALRQTSQNLETENAPLAQYADSFAEQVDKMSNYLRERDLSELFNDVRQVAQRQPEIFVAGALAAGFLLGRFLKSSGTSSYGSYSEQQYGETRPGFQSAYQNEYGNRAGSRSAAYTSSGLSRTNWQSEPFSSTQDIPVTGEENDAG